MQRNTDGERCKEQRETETEQWEAVGRNFPRLCSFLQGGLPDWNQVSVPLQAGAVMDVYLPPKASFSPAQTTKRAANTAWKRGTRCDVGLCSPA